MKASDAIGWSVVAAWFGAVAVLTWKDHVEAEVEQRESFQRQIDYLVAEVAKLTHPEEAKEAK